MNNKEALNRANQKLEILEKPEFWHFRLKNLEFEKIWKLTKITMNIKQFFLVH